MLYSYYRNPYGASILRYLAIPVLLVCFGFSNSSWGEEEDPTTSMVAASEAPLELDTMTVTGGADPSLITPSFETVKQDFMCRPGGQTVIDSNVYKRGKIANQQDIFRLTPGVWTAARNAGTSTRISIRGSDIDASGPRNGRGVRSFQDGIPYGRLEAGTTNALIDILATDYVEIYRGPNSLRLGPWLPAVR